MLRESGAAIEGSIFNIDHGGYMPDTSAAPANHVSMRFLTYFYLTLVLTLVVTVAASRPNILFIYADDQSYRTVSAYPEAHDYVHTPAIDSLAENGVRFAHAFIGTWCMPSRATMLTGHHQYGVQSMRMEGAYPGSAYDPEACPFWPMVFRENGYQTAQIGKWHTGVDTGRGRDWDYQIVWNRPANPKTSGHYYYDQPVTYPDGETRNLEEYSTDAYTRWALEYIRGEKGREAGNEKPWYLWLCYGAVHGPFTPAKRHIGALADAEIEVPSDIFGPREGKPDWVRDFADFKKGADGEPIPKHGMRSFADAVRQYHEGVLAIDEGVAQLVAALKETGQYENTLIVYTADQGFAWGQHGFRRKQAGYDATIRAPLIVSMPSRLPSGSVVETPVGGVDLVPTFFDFAKLELPWKMHGHSLRPLLEDPGAEWDHPMLMTFTGRSYGTDTDAIPADEGGFRNGIPWYSMLRKDQFKYIRPFVEGELDELYDLERDPEELHNLIENPEYASVIEDYRREMIAELERTGAGFANALPKMRTEK